MREVRKDSPELRSSGAGRMARLFQTGHPTGEGLLETGACRGCAGTGLGRSLWRWPGRGTSESGVRGPVPGGQPLPVGSGATGGKQADVRFSCTWLMHLMSEPMPSIGNSDHFEFKQ